MNLNPDKTKFHVIDSDDIPDFYIRDIERYGVVGDELKVKILSIDPTNGFLRVSYKQVPFEEMYSSHKESNKNISIADKIAVPLASIISPIWLIFKL